MAMGQHRQQSRVAWIIVSLIIGVLMGAAFYTVYLTLQANRRVGELVAQQAQTADRERSTITCGVHDIVENQRTMLLAIRDLIEPDRGPVSSDIKRILHRLDQRIADLTPVDIEGLDCPLAPGPSPG